MLSYLSDAKPRSAWMITYVSGKLKEKRPAEAVVAVNGLGYSVFIPTSTYERLPSQGEEVKLLTYLYVREDALRLFGFATEAERVLFMLMISVVGVGPRLALAALSTASPQELRQYILQNNSQMLTRVPGIGRKTADRLVVELRDRVDALALGDARPTSFAQDRSDALAALETLGFTRAAAERRLRVVQRKHPSVTAANELIRLALQQ